MLAMLFIVVAFLGVGATAEAAQWDKAPGSPGAAALSSSAIRVTWTDTNSQESGYSLERSLSSTGPWTVVWTGPTNATSCDDAGLSASTRYYYRIQSFKDGGSANKPTRSYGAYSTTVNAQTLAPSATTTTVTTSSTTSTTVANRPPIASAGLDRTVSVNTAVTFDGSGSYDPDAGDSIVQYTWDFGDGSPLTDGLVVSHTFTTAVQRTVILYVRDSYSAWGTDTAVITVTSGQVSTTTSSTSTSISIKTTTSTSVTSTSSTTSTTIAGSTSWSRTFAGTSAQSGNASVIDAAGNVYVGGYFMGSMTVGTTTLTSAGDLDGYVAKYDAAGTLQWIRQVGSTGGDTIDGIAVDSGGGVIAVGRFTGTINPGGGSLVSLGGTDILVIKYTASGGHTWSRRYGGTQDDLATAVAVDGSGNAYFTGFFSGTVDFGGGPISVPYVTDSDVYLTKVSTTGAFVWAKGFVNWGNEVGNGVAVSSTGEVVLVGSFNATVNFGGSDLVANDIESDGFVAKFSSAGVHQWSKRFGDVMADTARAVAIDSAGNIAVTGDVRGSVNFGGATLTGDLNYADTFVVSYGPTGTHRWSRRTTSSTPNDGGYGIAIDGSGNVAVVGTFEGTANVGTTLTSAGLRDVFLASYAGSTGSLLWGERWGGTDDDRGFGVGAGADGVSGVGSFKSTATIGGTTVTSAGTTDGFVAQRLLP